MSEIEEKKMPGYALIMGGTRGLGAALARESVTHGKTPIILGRTAGMIQTQNRLDIKNAIYTAFDFESDQSQTQLSPKGTDRLTHVFWTAGTFLEKALTDASVDEIDQMINVHLRGPVKYLANLHRLMKVAHALALHPGQPYHLVVIGSTSAWRVRENQTLYCALKAAKITFARNFARELVADLPGSKVTIVNPGGMKTDFLAGSSQDISNFMDPHVIARIIWNEVLMQKSVFCEFALIRAEDGTSRFELGPHMPEGPF